MLTPSQFEELDLHSRAVYLATGELLSDEQVADARDLGILSQILVSAIISDPFLKKLNESFLSLRDAIDEMRKPLQVFFDVLNDWYTALPPHMKRRFAVEPSPHHRPRRNHPQRRHH